MLLSHHGKSPDIHPSAYIAPNACVCGDVVVGAGSRVLFGAQIIAEEGAIRLGNECIVMENAVLRSSGRHQLTVGDNCLIGPNAHVVGCIIEEECFVATGSAIFHSAHLGKGCEVRVNGVVHLKTHLPPKTILPIGWVAVGNPARLFPASEHDKIWEIQKPLDFPGTVYGFERSQANMVKITRSLSERMVAHKDDTESATNSQRKGY